MPEIFSNTTLTVNQLIEKIDTGELGLPELQRPFIWKDSKVRDLFDTMMRGYPIVTCSLPRTPLSSSVISSRNWVTIDPPKGPSLQMKNRA